MKNEYELQAEEVLKKAGVTMQAFFSHHGKHFQGDKQTRDIYNVTLKNDRTEYTFQFGQSITNSGEKHIFPAAYDVLSCLTKSDPGTHEEFCGDMGIDTDSRKGLETYLAVQRE